MTTGDLAVNRTLSEIVLKVSSSTRFTRKVYTCQQICCYFYILLVSQFAGVYAAGSSAVASKAHDVYF